MLRCFDRFESVDFGEPERPVRSGGEASSLVAAVDTDESVRMRKLGTGIVDTTPHPGHNARATP